MAQAGHILPDELGLIAVIFRQERGDAAERNLLDEHRKHRICSRKPALEGQHVKGRQLEPNLRALATRSQSDDRGPITLLAAHNLIKETLRERNAAAKATCRGHVSGAGAQRGVKAAERKHAAYK